MISMLTHFSLFIAQPSSSQPLSLASWLAWQLWLAGWLALLLFLTALLSLSLQHLTLTTLFLTPHSQQLTDSSLFFLSLSSLSASAYALHIIYLISLRDGGGQEQTGFAWEFVA